MNNTAHEVPTKNEDIINYIISTIMRLSAHSDEPTDAVADRFFRNFEEALV